jgi:hypothetical protein
VSLAREWPLVYAFGTFEVIKLDDNSSWNHGHVQEVAAMSQSVLEMTKDLVLAQIRSGTLSHEDMQALHN